VRSLFRMSSKLTGRSMKSRFFAHLWFCLFLLFAQHVTLAEALTQYTSGDHQCALEESCTSDSDTGKHSAQNDFDSGIISFFELPVAPSVPHVQAQSLVIEFLSIVSPHYSTRAPPYL
jgi:hypothetical protein